MAPTKTAAQKAAEEKKAEERAARKKALEAVATGNADVSVKALDTKARDTLARAVQARLIALGCLDPKVDGEFGPNSQRALMAFARHQHLPYDGALTPKIAHALLEETPDSFLPLTLGKDLASRIVKYMLAQKQFVARLDGYLTIVYLEGSTKAGVPARNVFDQWNDRRMLLRIAPGGKPEIVLNILATTEPGRLQKERADGTAHIALGQQKGWVVGTHTGASGNNPHEALIQRGRLAIVRDKNHSGHRDKGDTALTGSGMGINQHSAFRDPSHVGEWSAGCLVAQDHEGHKKFMRLVKKDPRYKATHDYRFMTAVIAAKSLPK
ncbi:peptidoglycan-binding protein [Spongisporangium articulatum]|uniref:Peptidoglycan-binding protein n=1 Tax=Spongisporangium articulatum TaxID=3362603 RepID=A0ABW8AMK9_9ACTN